MRTVFFREEDYPQEAQKLGFMPALYPATKKTAGKDKGYPVRSFAYRFLRDHPRFLSWVKRHSGKGSSAVSWEVARQVAICDHAKRSQETERGEPTEQMPCKKPSEVPF
jgi:hypothetical protein